jgi:hypothetical protein
MECGGSPPLYLGEARFAHALSVVRSAAAFSAASS